MSLSVPFTLHFLKDSEYKAQKALIAAYYNGQGSGKPVPAIAAVETKKGEKLDPVRNPWQRLPVLTSEKGSVGNSTAIAKYVGSMRADSNMMGNSFFETCRVDSWLEFGAHDLEEPACALVWLQRGLISVPDKAAAMARAAADLSAALAKVEAALKANAKQQAEDVVAKFGGGASGPAKPVLVGADVTLADVCLCVALLDVYTEVLAVEGAGGLKASFPGVCAWMQFLVKEAEFRAVLTGKHAAVQGKWCAKSAVTAAASSSFAPPARGSGGSAPAKKDAAPAKKEAAAAAPAPAGGSGSAGDMAALEVQKEQVRALKAAKADKAEITAAVDELKRLKKLCGE